MRFPILVLTVGLCAWNDAKLAQLEKENGELRKQIADSKHVDLATQEKCSNAAPRYFQREYPAYKNTLLLTINAAKPLQPSARQMLYLY
jgi:hypothetical protein